MIGEAPAGVSAAAPEATLSAEQWREVEAPSTAGKNTIMSLEEVAKHAGPDDCWLVVEDKVYDVTKFMEDHPGGPKPLVLYGGKDATEEFTMIHHPDIIKAYGELYRVGVVEGTEAAAAVGEASVAVVSEGGFYTLEEVAQHSSKADCWVIVHDGVYDVTEFLDIHPGGAGVLAGLGGKDATEFFDELHRPEILEEIASEYKIGVIGEAPAGVLAAAPAAPVAKQTASGAVTAPPMFGELVPSGDPQWYQGFRSPHYKETHFAFRDKCRAFVEQEIDPYVEDWEKYAYFDHGEGPAPEKQVPHMALMKKAAEWGLLPATMGSEWPSDFTDTPAPEDYDLFHNQILIEELGRPSSEIASIILTGMIIGLRSVMQFGLQNPKVTHEVVSSCLSGDKQICLCMSEPYAGSDVAGLTTRAELSADGTHYILNGEKKWITGGVYSDYFNVACRTEGEGSDGLSMLLVKRDFGGVKTQKMDVTGWWASGTTYVTFEDVKVPVEYVVGTSGNGFRQMMVSI